MSYGRVFYYYWPQIKKYKKSFFLVFFAYGVAVVFSNIIKPILYKEVIDLVSTSTPSMANAEYLLNLLFWVVACMIFFNIGYRTGDYAITYFQSNVMREIHNDTFRRLTNHSYKFFSNTFSGSLVAKAKRFTASFERLDDVVSFNLWFTFVEMIGMFLVLFWTIPQLGYIFLGWGILYLVITFLFIRKKITYDILEAAADSKVTARFADSFTNILNIKIFSGKLFERGLFEATTFDESLKRSKSWNFGNLQNATQAALMVTLEAIVLYILINLWLEGGISAGMFALVQFYMMSIFRQLWEVGKSLVRFFKSLADAKEMTDIFDQVPDILDPNNPEVCKISKGDINFLNVNFEYVENVPVFENFNLKVKPGEKVGLVGHSGSGKSTITKILLRFADVVGGEVLIDGQNVANLRQDDLRSKISYVPQEPMLFHRPIRENIAYSKPSATEEEIIEVAKKAHAHEFITKLPKGYDTLVGERGVKLSGGERQRVAIARAMLKDSPVLVLDEATSSLDSISESYIQDSFQELMKGKTTIVIAHRLSTIQKMDRIIVLDKGKIAEEGTHHDLLVKGGLYAELWEHQTGGFLE